MFSRLFQRKPDKADDHALIPIVEKFDLHSTSAGRMVVPDWTRIEESLAERLVAGNEDEIWNAVALCWMDAMRDALGDGYAIQASENFLLLSPAPARERQLFLDYAEKTQKRILRLLDGVAAKSGIGKSCVIAFASEDDYYEYVSNYYPEDGEFALSGGMYINWGYGHFVCVADDMRAIEPMVAHEMTHLHLTHLPLPAWLNEGLAVLTEHALSPPAGQLHTPQELMVMHRKFWNESTIQEFWSGKSYLRPDDGNMLSYDLGRQLTALLSRDRDRFVAFANSADLADAGNAAALDTLGHELDKPIAFLLGAGDWRPRPEAWAVSPERGGFNLAAMSPGSSSLGRWFGL